MYNLSTLKSSSSGTVAAEQHTLSPSTLEDSQKKKNQRKSHGNHLKLCVKLSSTGMKVLYKHKHAIVLKADKGNHAIAENCQDKQS